MYIMCIYVIVIAHVAGFKCFNVCTRTMHNALGYVMHSPSARALRNLERYCIVLVHTLKHAKPATWAMSDLLLVT